MPQKFSIIIISILVLAIAIIVGSRAGQYFGERQKQKKQEVLSRQILANVKQLNIGDTLPNHKFEVIGGDSVWLKDLLSDKCVLIVSIPQCHECVLEAQELQSAITDESDSKHFIFATWENPKLLEDIKKENNLYSPFLYDHKRAYFSQFDISTYPFNITLDKNGVVLDMLAGAMWKNDFEEIIEYNKLSSTANN